MAASLMGAVDTAVVGHLGNYTYINAVSLGAVIFSTVYWLFGFLKISTSGFAAQALGQHDPKLLAGAFIRGVLAAFGIGLLLVILQEPIWRTALLLFNPDAATRPMLEQYYRMLIWIMPLTLVFQTAQGWFAGTLHVRIAVLTALASNIINLLLDLKEQQNLTYMFITHDLSVVKYISDRVGVMYLGSMVELAGADEIFHHPIHPYTEALLNAIPTTDTVGAKELSILEGDIPSPVNPPKGCKFHTRCKYCTEICTQVVPEWEEVRPNHFVACHHKLEVKE